MDNAFGQALMGSVSFCLGSSNMYRNGCPGIFYEIDTFKNFTKFTRKHLCWSF